MPNLSHPTRSSVLAGLIIVVLAVLGLWKVLDILCWIIEHVSITIS